MAQQTQIGRVEERLPAFLATFPTPGAMAAAAPADVVRAWRGLGYNRRAIALHRAAVAIAAAGGRVPDDVAALEALPGVGPYTARAVAAIAFGRPVGAVDVNVRRVVGRLVVERSRRGCRPGRCRRPRTASSTRSGRGPGRTPSWTSERPSAAPLAPACPSCPARPWCVTAATRGAAAGREPDRDRRAARPTRPAPVPFELTTRWLRGTDRGPPARRPARRRRGDRRPARVASGRRGRGRPRSAGPRRDRRARRGRPRQAARPPARAPRPPAGPGMTPPRRLDPDALERAFRLAREQVADGTVPFAILAVASADGVVRAEAFPGPQAPGHRPRHDLPAGVDHQAGRRDRDHPARGRGPGHPRRRDRPLRAGARRAGSAAGHHLAPAHAHVRASPTSTSRSCSRPGPTARELLRRAATAEPRFAPGSRYEYVSSSFELLAAIIERVRGEPLEAALRRTILGPLGMADTTFAPSGRRLLRVAPLAAATGPERAAAWVPRPGVPRRGALLRRARPRRRRPVRHGGRPRPVRPGDAPRRRAGRGADPAARATWSS